jgi:hypothetical protein
MELVTMRWFWVIWLAAGLMSGHPARGAASSRSPLGLIPPTVLAFDASLKQCQAKAGATNALFCFWVTNVCVTNVVIFSVSTSCGCAVAHVPTLPWVIEPGQAGAIKVDLDLQGRRGIVIKGVEITSSAGVAALVVRANVPEPPPPAAGTNQAPRSGRSISSNSPVRPPALKPVTR